MKTVKELLRYLEGAVQVEGDRVVVLDEAALPDKMDEVVEDGPTL